MGDHLRTRRDDLSFASSFAAELHIAAELRAAGVEKGARIENNPGVALQLQVTGSNPTRHAGFFGAAMTGENYMCDNHPVITFRWKT